LPIYEFTCGACGNRFEELTASDTAGLACPHCGSDDTERLLSAQAPVRRLVRTGARVSSDASRRREREAQRRERLADAKRRRAAGESLRPRKGTGA
jgi:putative FmdB family regulatory protein